MEVLKIVKLLANANKLDRYSQLPMNGNDYAALCCTVKLCKDDSRNVGGFAEKLRLIYSVRPVVASRTSSVSREQPSAC